MSDPTAAPAPLRLGGNEYKAYPFRDVDHEEFNKWCRREYLERVKEATSDPQLLEIAVRQAAGMEWTDENATGIVNSVKGIHKISCLLIRNTTPYDDVNTKEGVREVMRVFAELHPPQEPTGDEGKSGN